MTASKNTISIPLLGRRADHKALYNIVIDNPERGTLILGEPGSGKTILLLEIIRKHINQAFTMCVFDFKENELYKAIKLMLKESKMSYLSQYGCNPTLKRITFSDPANSERHNPMSTWFIKDESHARHIARTILKNVNSGAVDKNDEYTTALTDLLTGCILLLKSKEDKNALNEGGCSFPHLIELMSLDTATLITLLKKESGLSDFIPYQNDHPSQVEAIHMGLRLPLNRYKFDELYWIMSGDSGALAVNDSERPCILLVENRTELSYTVKAPIALYLTHAANSFIPTPECRSAFIVDELSTVYLEDIGGLIENNKNNNVATYLTADTYKSIQRTYGLKAPDTLNDHIGNFISGVISTESATLFCDKLMSPQINPSNLTQLSCLEYMGGAIAQNSSSPSREYFGHLPVDRSTFAYQQESDDHKEIDTKLADLIKTNRIRIENEILALAEQIS